MTTTTTTTETGTATMKTLRYGIEIETVGRTRQVLANAVAAAIGGTVRYVGTYYDVFAVTMTDGREWKFMRDGSLSTANSAEVVSPILTYTDLDLLQTIVRTLRGAGATVDTSCGIHVHVDGARLDAGSIVRLAKTVHTQEAVLAAALGIQRNRLERFTKPLAADLVARISTAKTIDEIKAAWYGTGAAHRMAHHYDKSRYHGLNLHSYFFRGTIEFRYFEASLHAGRVKSYVHLCLAMMAFAIDSKAARAKPIAFDANTGRYQVRVFMKRLGLLGDEFKSTRHHLMSLVKNTADARVASARPRRARAAAVVAA